MSSLLQYHTSVDWNQNDALKFFHKHYTLRPSEQRNILEIGTKRWYAHPTHHQSVLAPYTSYTMTDVEGGQDVDVVTDLHLLSSIIRHRKFDVIWCSSVFEHLHSPWVAAEQLLKCLMPGGLFFIQTHQTFPIHGYPHDYFRFSAEALAHLFSSASELVTGYDFPCKIEPQDKRIDWNYAAPAYLNSCISGIK